MPIRYTNEQFISSFLKNIFTACMLLAYPVLSYSQAKLIAPTSGGADQFGSIISMTPGATDFSSQLNFRGYSGGVPRRLKLLQASNGKLYGLTSRGGSNFGGGPGSGMGILFEYDLASGAYINKQNFLGDNGSLPYGSLIQASNGKLYGMTSEGGANNLGVIFEYDLNANIYTKKIDMTKAIGSRPLGSFVEAAPGKLLACVTTGATTGAGPGTGGIIEYDFNTNTYINKIVFVDSTGITSEGDLVKATGDGKYYGLTRAGGLNAVGVIFQYDYATNTYIKKRDFTSAFGHTPVGSLVNAPNGKLYGLTSAGGIGDHVGSLIEYNYTNNNLVRKVNMSDALGGSAYGSLLLADNGKFYGLARRGGADIYKSGALFEYDYVANVYTKKIDLYDSTGSSPEGTLIQLGTGKIYGTTTSGGALYSGNLFEYDIIANSFTKKFTFGVSDGKDCAAPMMKAANGILYGTTFSGGPNGIGSIYSYDPVANTYTNLYNCASEGAFPATTMVEASPGKLYGTMSGEIFEFDYFTNTYTHKFQFVENQGYDGRGDLLKGINGKLYGTTFYGGADEDLPPLENWAAGVIFEYDPVTNIYAKKYDLNDHINHDGMSPYSGLVEVSPGIVYGTTTGGGLNGIGVIFEYNYLTNTYTKKFDFMDAAVSGSTPAGKLMLGANGQLFGATSTGGTFGAGTLFKYDFNTNVFTKQYDFNGTTDGATPTGFLLQSSNGKIYGLTHTGGDNDFGVVFEYNYNDSIFTVKKSFSAATGGWPRAGFVELNASGHVTYIFTGDGDWTLASNWLNNSMPPAVLPAGDTIIVDPVINGKCFLNISQVIGPGSTLIIRANKKFEINSNLTVQE